MSEQENDVIVMQNKTDSEDLKMMQLLNPFTPSKLTSKVRFRP